MMGYWVPFFYWSGVLAWGIVAWGICWVVTEDWGKGRRREEEKEPSRGVWWWKRVDSRAFALPKERKNLELWLLVQVKKLAKWQGENSERKGWIGVEQHYDCGEMSTCVVEQVRRIPQDDIAREMAGESRGVSV